jgi:hypothetical protein
MNDLKEIIAVSCDECNGAGFIFWGNDNSFDVEACDCVDDGSLFTNGENE